MNLIEEYINLTTQKIETPKLYNKYPNTQAEQNEHRLLHAGSLHHAILHSLDRPPVECIVKLKSMETDYDREFWSTQPIQRRRTASIELSFPYPYDIDNLFSRVIEIETSQYKIKGYISYTNHIESAVGWRLEADLTILEMEVQ